MKKNKEVRDQVEKKGFVEKYEEITKALRKAIIVIVYLVVSFPLFTAGSYYVTWQLIGDGVYSYSEEAYDNIKTLLSYDIVANVGIDKFHIINATEDTIKQLNTEESSEVISEEDKPRIIDEYDENYKNGTITLRCRKSIGKFFTAEVTQIMSNDFNTIETRRNYDTVKDYMKFFQRHFAACVIGGAFGAWILFTGFLCLIAFIVATIIKKFIKKEDDTEDSVDVCEEADKATEA